MAKSGSKYFALYGRVVTVVPLRNQNKHFAMDKTLTSGKWQSFLAFLKCFNANERIKLSVIVIKLNFDNVLSSESYRLAESRF